MHMVFPEHTLLTSPHILFLEHALLTTCHIVYLECALHGELFLLARTEGLAFLMLMAVLLSVHVPGTRDDDLMRASQALPSWGAPGTCNCDLYPLMRPSRALPSWGVPGTRPGGPLPPMQPVLEKRQGMPSCPGKGGGRFLPEKKGGPCRAATRPAV
jgi:hypothetical protein